MKCLAFDCQIVINMLGYINSEKDDKTGKSYFTIQITNRNV